MTKREILRAEKRQQKVAVFAFVKAKHICFLGRFGGELPQEEILYPLGGVRRGSPRTPPVLFFFLEHLAGYGRDWAAPERPHPGGRARSLSINK